MHPTVVETFQFYYFFITSEIKTSQMIFVKLIKFQFILNFQFKSESLKQSFQSAAAFSLRQLTDPCSGPLSDKPAWLLHLSPSCSTSPHVHLSQLCRFLWFLPSLVPPEAKQVNPWIIDVAAASCDMFIFYHVPWHANLLHLHQHRFNLCLNDKAHHSSYVSDWSEPQLHRCPQSQDKSTAENRTQQMWFFFLSESRCVWSLSLKWNFILMSHFNDLCLQ